MQKVCLEFVNFYDLDYPFLVSNCALRVMCWLKILNNNIDVWHCNYLPLLFWQLYQFCSNFVACSVKFSLYCMEGIRTHDLPIMLSYRFNEYDTEMQQMKFCF